jgi:superfamily II DNA or RNA helicase
MPVDADRPRDASVRFRPRLTLQTLGRGDGLLGMKPSGPFGPRADQVTIARVEWLYTHPHGHSWATPAPSSVLHARPERRACFMDEHDRERPFERDLAAEADALDVLLDTPLRPLPEGVLQWRAPGLARAVAQPGEPLWSLILEDQFADFWSDQIPLLQAQGWSVIVRPGFAHLSVPVTAWKLIVSPVTGEAGGHELTLDQPLPTAKLQALGQPHGEGSWLITLGIEVEGQRLDLAPLIADLLKRDRRWLKAHELALISPTERILLRAPGGKRIECPAAPLKAIVGHMVDLMTAPGRLDQPFVLSDWDAPRIEHLREQLAASQAERAGPQGQWQLQGEEGLLKLTQRLRAAGSPQPVVPPMGLQVTLRPYQLQGLAWLQYLRAQQLGGILADDMGLGKTAQALAHLLLEKEQGRLDQPALVVMPTSLLFNWQAEARRMAPGLRVHVWHGPERLEAADQLGQHDLILSTYPLVWRDIDALAAQPFHTLILDEAQTVKNAASLAAAAVRRIPARHRLCLTGTPLENHLGELWSQFDFLMPGFLGTMRAFQRQWRDPIEQNGETARAALLASRVRPFILRRRKSEVATELPPKTEVIQRVRLEGKQKALYESVRVAADELVRRALTKQGFEGAQISILDALLKLRQVCCDPWLLKGARLPRSMERAKLDWLLDTLPCLVDEGRRVLVFSQFTEMLQLLAEQLTDKALPHLLLTGQTPPTERGEVVRRFQAQEVPLLLLSLKAGGVGLNLTAADTVIHLDPWWNPAVAAQATDRAHRLGQTQAVMVYQLVVEGSIEERILALQARKSALADSVLGHDPAVAAKFSQADLDALLAPLAG